MIVEKERYVERVDINENGDESDQKQNKKPTFASGMEQFVRKSADTGRIDRTGRSACLFVFH